MNAMTTLDRPFYVAEMLAPADQMMADVEVLDTPEKTNALLGYLSQLTHYSYDAWIARGDLLGSVE